MIKVIVHKIPTVAVQAHSVPEVKVKAQGTVILTTAESIYDMYKGGYSVSPRIEAETILSTKNKILTEDVTVKAIPVREVPNEYGTTVYIAMED